MGQGPLGANWGDGFGTDPEAVTILQQSGLPQSDPNPFFQKLMVCAARTHLSAIVQAHKRCPWAVHTKLLQMQHRSCCSRAVSAAHYCNSAHTSVYVSDADKASTYQVCLKSTQQTLHRPRACLPQVSPYLSNVILSPHIYPPSVTNAPSNYSGAGLNYRLSRSFGSKMKEASMPCQRCIRQLLPADPPCSVAGHRNTKSLPVSAGRVQVGVSSQPGLHRQVAFKLHPLPATHGDDECASAAGVHVQGTDSHLPRHARRVGLLLQLQPEPLQLQVRTVIVIYTTDHCLYIARPSLHR